MIVVPFNSALKNPSNTKQRQRAYPLNVRIDETNVKQVFNRIKNYIVSNIKFIFIFYLKIFKEYGIK